MTRPFEVALLHDYFVDRLVHVGSLHRLESQVRAKAAAGGGGIHGIPQQDVAGGNAVNMARALARLGARTLLITHSDPSHEPLLRRSFEGLGAELRVKDLPPAFTVALEGRVNVMLGDSGGAADFGPGLLDENDWSDLKSSRVVCVLNWAANQRGTELLSALRKRLGQSKTIFFDPADFRDRMGEFGRLLGIMKARKLVDWVSLNEAESEAACHLLALRPQGLEGRCLSLAQTLGAALDIHTSSMSLTSDGLTVVTSKVAKSRPRRLTGAGDVWNAASVFGRLKGMPDRQRLRFANTSAGLYLEAAAPLPPTLGQVESELN